MSGVLLPGTAQAPQVLSGYTASGAGGVGFAGSALPGPTAPYAGIWAFTPLVSDSATPSTTTPINLPPGEPDTAIVVVAAGGSGSTTFSLSDSFATHYTWALVASSPSGGNYGCAIFLGTRSGAASTDLVGTVTINNSASASSNAIAVPLLGAQGVLAGAGNGNGSSSASGTSLPMGSVSPTMTTVLVGVLLAVPNLISAPTSPSGMVVIPISSSSGEGFVIIVPNLAAGTYNPTPVTNATTTVNWSSAIAVFD